MKFTANSLAHIINDLQKVKENHINNISLINNREFLITFSFYKKEKLYISLNHSEPFVSLISFNEPLSTIENKTNEILRKEIKNAFIKSISQFNNDRVILVNFVKKNDFFELINRNLYIELIPNRPNLIITDENNKIIFVLHQTTLESKRPLIKGLTYSILENGLSTISKDNFDLESYKKQCLDYIQISINNRLKEKYDNLFKFIKSKIKSLQKKKTILLEEINKAKTNLIYQEHGNVLLSFSKDAEAIKEYIENNKLDFDFTISLGLNANKYFKIYKKAKRTIQCDEEEISKCDNEINRLSFLVNEIQFLNEEDFIQIRDEFFPNKKNQTKKSKINISSIEVNQTKILFGKNAIQNNELTFSLASKNDVFMHVKSLHGAHIIIKNPNPSNEVLLTAAEIALLLSNQNDGEVNYTLVKNIKKGPHLGEALISEYKTIYLNKIREETKRTLTSVRF